MIETYSCYDFEVFGGNVDGNFVYYYEIYGEGCPPYYDGVIESLDYYDTEQEARFAAIGHISKLENNEEIE